MENVRVNLCFKLSTRTNTLPKSKWQQQSYLISFLNNFIIYFRIGITFRFNCYQQPNQVLGNWKQLNRRNFLLMQYDCYIQVRFGYLLKRGTTLNDLKRPTTSKKRSETTYNNLKRPTTNKKQPTTSKKWLETIHKEQNTT